MARIGRPWFGYDPTLEGDQVYNGADDNASGVAAVPSSTCFSGNRRATERDSVILLSGTVKKKRGVRLTLLTMTYPGVEENKRLSEL